MSISASKRKRAPHSKETIQKMIETKAAFSGERKKQIKEKQSLVAKKRTPEIIEKIAKARKLRGVESFQGGRKNKGSKRSLESRLKMRESRLQFIEKNGYPARDTSIELAIKKELQERSIDFEVQLRLTDFIVDFYLPRYKLVIECDGCWFHGCPECFPDGTPYANRNRDQFRDTKLIQSGYDIQRFWEHEINKSPKDCIDRLCL